jgi:hypothetical protein
MVAISPESSLAFDPVITRLILADIAFLPIFPNEANFVSHPTARSETEGKLPAKPE